MKNLKYIFVKFLICLLTEIPAFAVALLVRLIGGAAVWADVAAAAVGMVFFFAVMGGILKKLRLGDMPMGKFVLLETLGYALLLVLAAPLSRVATVRLFFLPQSLFTLTLGVFAIALNVPLYAILTVVTYRLNRKAERKKKADAAPAFDGTAEEI